MLVLLSAVACGDPPPPNLGPGPDGGGPIQVFDAGVWGDAATQGGDAADPSDGASGPDGATADGGGATDGGSDPNDGGTSELDGSADGGPEGDGGSGADGGGGVDGSSDGGPDPDGGGLDAGTPDGGADGGTDAGLPLLDSDGDTILDIHEGNGLVDTDGDGIPDHLDLDSDGDGIPDAVEAGDADPLTPPVDTDGDGIPDFRDLDSDNDGIPDAVEGYVDSDGDGIPDFRDLDSDGDFIADAHEGLGDPDGDGIPNYLDLDSDGDGLPDAFEAGDQNISTPPLDSDFDGVPNFLDLDSDNDFIADAHEGMVDSDGDTIPDYIDIDSDNDSVLDMMEAGDTDLATPPVDSDGDGVPDYLDLDSDGDTISDLHEGLVDTDSDGIPDRLDLDSDNDGWPDAVEAGDADLLTAPVDTDGDGIPDFRDLDSDGDGLADAVEPGCPAGPNRTMVDSDLDGFDDLAEVAYGSDPCSAASFIDHFYFVLPPGGPGANAPLVFSDTEIDRADLAINVDTTGSMQGEIDNLRLRLTDTIIPGVGAAIPDAAFAVSAFDDYPITPFGVAAAGDLPFRLLTRVTTSGPAAQAAVNQLAIRNGGDFPESGLESIYQITTGAGTSWPGGSVAAFNPNQNMVPGVADGTIGGVGFRADALPIIVHITDAISHTRRTYHRVSTGIGAAETQTVRNAIAGVGARVVTISSGLRPFNDLLCAGQISTFFGAIEPQNDVDWFLLQGAQAGDTITVDVFGEGFLSTLDPMVAIANATSLIATNNNAAAGTTDARLANVTLSGPAPYFIAVTAAGDPTFTGSGGLTRGHYLVNVSRNGAAMMPSPTTCRVEDANGRAGATALVDGALATAPADPAQCQADCDTILGGISPLFGDFTFPYELSEDTGAVIPPCAWSEFGPSRPAGCGPTQCCTGQFGAGVAPNAQGMCPLAFEISPTGAGLDRALVDGIQALVGFSTFTITTQLRGDPAALASTGIDTTCFIQSVVPVAASAPNTCAPTPVAVDLFPPPGQLDSFEDVVPGSILSFQVNALNQDPATGLPCAASLASPRQFTAYIDVVADGVTVVDTRQVIIIVPPTAPGGSN